MTTPASYAWQPCTSRVVVVDGFGPYPRGTFPTVPAPLVWPVKDPGDVLDYVVDFSRALAGNDGDSIATLDVSITPGNAGDLVLQSSSADGDLAILWLGQGISGTSYAVSVLAGTNSGRIFSRTVTLPVATLSTPLTSTNDITDQNGMPLSNASGTPLTVL